MFYAWDFRISLDFFFGGLGLGAFLLAASTYYINRERYRWTIRVASFLAPVFVVIGLLFLLSELGRPEKAIITLWNFNPTSLISWGGLLQFLFIIVAALFYWKIKKEQYDKMTHFITGLGSAFALLICIYHGYLLTSIGRDAWSGVLPLLFLLVSVLSGFAFMVLLNILFNKNDQEKGPGLNLPIIMIFLIVFTGIGVFSWIYGLYVGNAEKILIYKLITGKYALMTFGGIFAAGLMAPGILFFLNSKLKKNSINKISTIAGCILVISGSFLIRHLILLLGQTSF